MIQISYLIKEKVIAYNNLNHKVKFTLKNSNLLVELMRNIHQALSIETSHIIARDLSFSNTCMFSPTPFFEQDTELFIEDGKIKLYCSQNVQILRESETFWPRPHGTTYHIHLLL